MIWLAEIGHLSLIISFAWSLVFGLRVISFTIWSRVLLSLLSLATFILAICFLDNDYSVLYVYNNSYQTLPWYYRICAVWGAHEGSWLLFTWILSFWTALAAILVNKLEQQLKYYTQQNLAVIFVGFIGFMLFTSNPFLRILPNIPDSGHGLNPLLQDPGMILHPPILYSGYVGLIVTFALALAALRQSNYSTAWLQPAAIITKLAWMFLTAGIVLGSWWAYRELGWGGFWGWDPVENASLLPWLTASALIHLLRFKTKQKYHQQMILLFAALSFFLSILGTFLLRSGLVISVHAFAQDPGRGLALLILLAIIIIVCLYHAYKRLDNLNSLPQESQVTNLKLVQAQAWLFATAAATVLLGTIYPLISTVVWHENLSVGAPYFNQMLLPNLVLAICLMSLLLKDILYARLVCTVIALLSIALSILIFAKLSAEAICFTLVTFVLLQTIYAFCTSRKKLFLVAHLGFLLMLTGVIVSSNFSSANTELLQVGDSIKIKDNLYARLTNIKPSNGPNYKGYTANFLVAKQMLQAEDRLYTASGVAMPKVGIITSWLGSDIYLAFAINDKGWLVRSYYKPLVRWIWWGGILMVLATLLSFFTSFRQIIRRK